MDRNRLEKKILRQLRTFLKPGMSLTISMDTRVIMDIGMDSMDFMMLTDNLEKEFGIRVSDCEWNAFWSDSEVTVAQLCDFVEHCLNNNLKRNGTHRKEHEMEV